MSKGANSGGVIVTIKSFNLRSYSVARFCRGDNWMGLGWEWFPLKIVECDGGRRGRCVLDCLAATNGLERPLRYWAPSL